MAKIFKAYDIRGITPDELDAEGAHRIGRATARFIGAATLAVGRDARRSSPELFEALVRGINDEGVDVVDLGLVSTPMLYYAVETLEAGGGIMVTASHNPAQYNGFKICREHAIPIGEASGLLEIEKGSAEIADEAPRSKRGTIRSVDVREGYVDHVLTVGRGRPRLKVAIDCGNGMAAVGLEPLLERLDLEVERLYFEPDGTFPNHEADPLKPENLSDLVAAVRRTGADLGVAFDGDADRAVIVDNAGVPIPSDLMTALLARRQLERKPGGRVLYDLRSSRATAEEIEAAGGVAEMSRVGHSFVKAHMRKVDAIFAGELSGHFYFRDHYFAECADLALLMVLRVLSRHPEPFSEIVRPLLRYHHTGEVNFQVEDPDGRIEALAEAFGDGRQDRTDGLLVEYDDWWFNVRKSNTEP
ncbi:MAG: phosphomannomutase/phosphoglucomutase, partial [Myxococcales bacterium]|nr:phosphomannomutase/phosphoglucomutase [Myxococcales bacterium]